MTYLGVHPKTKTCYPLFGISHAGERYKCRGILREWAEMPGIKTPPEGENDPVKEENV